MPANLTLPEVVPHAKLRNLLETISASIGRNTARPDITHFERDARFDLAVDPRDQGRMVGKSGTTIWAIRTILYFAGLTVLGYSYTVRLLDPEVPQKDGHPFRFDPKWSRQRIRGLVDAILSTCLPRHATYTLEELTDTSVQINLKITKYLRINLADPNFADAFAIVLKTAGMSNGVSIITQTDFS